MFDYNEMFYNPRRRHSHVGGVSPEAFECASNHDLAVVEIESPADDFSKGENTLRKIILALSAVAAATILGGALDAFASDFTSGLLEPVNGHFTRSEQGTRFSMTEMVNQDAAGYYSPGSGARSSPRFGLRKLHRYLGYGTLILAGVAAVSGSESDLHCGAAYAATGTAAATCVTGFMKYHRRWNLSKGLFHDDNAHIMLGVIGGIGMVASVISADSDSGPGHAGIGAAGGALMAVSVILIKW